MDLKILKDTPPWDWPEGASATFLDVLRDTQAAEPDRLLAAELAGDLVAINDDLVGALLTVLGNAVEPEKLRATAAISLGPVLEHADTDGFEDPDNGPITERTFHAIQQTLHKLYWDAGVPKEVRRRVLEAAGGTRTATRAAGSRRTKYEHFACACRRARRRITGERRQDCPIGLVIAALVLASEATTAEEWRDAKPCFRLKAL